jgi:hypothetical protein
MGKMEFPASAILMPYNYFEWKRIILHQLRGRGLYLITMAMEVEPDCADEKNDFLNRQDMAIGCICLYISPEIYRQVDDESQDSTPNKLWTELEVLFGNKEDCMQKDRNRSRVQPEPEPEPVINRSNRFQ